MGRRKELIWPDGPMSFAVFFVTGTTSTVGNRLGVVINVVAAVEAAKDSWQARWRRWPTFTALMAQMWPL